MIHKYSHTCKTKHTMYFVVKMLLMTCSLNWTTLLHKRVKYWFILNPLYLFMLYYSSSSKYPKTSYETIEVFSILYCHYPTKIKSHQFVQQILLYKKIRSVNGGRESWREWIIFFHLYSLSLTPVGL